MPVLGFAQSTNLPQGSKFDHLMERLEILQQSNHDLNLTTAKPISRKLAAQTATAADSFRLAQGDSIDRFSAVDRAGMEDLLMNTSEWATGDKEAYKSRHPLWHTFYPTKANFVEVNEKDFFLALNPVIQEQQSKESGNSERVFLNSKGLTLRGRIGSHLGFSTYLTDNQERGPAFVMDRISEFSAVPGAGYYKDFKATAVDYFDARGSINFDVWKYFEIQFGYDKNFIGNGYRSLFLSDYSAPYLFLKLNTRIWKFNYQNIFMELVSQYQRSGDYQYPKKYAVVHHLSFDATRWLNLGLYQNVVFSRANYFDFSYLNPVIFLVSAQQQNGSPDKTTVGLDFKANVAHSFQFYGQLVINEFVLKEVTHYSNGWWGNKQGLQLGGKYINAFGAKNLDLQLETNIVRPFTYSHNDSVSNFSHYNQPLAHPLGANFAEVVAIARYQPAYRWTLEGKIIYYKQGLDSAGVNYGGNIFENYSARPRDYGFNIGSGILAKCVNISGLVSWECRENLFLELSAMYRKFSVNDPSGVYKPSSSTMITAGIRMNMFRRQYDY